MVSYEPMYFLEFSTLNCLTIKSSEGQQMGILLGEEAGHGTSESLLAFM
jgi:hypothetical protein